MEDDDDHVAVGELILELHQPRHRGAARVADPDAFFARDPTRHHGRVLVGHLFEMIDAAEVDVARQEVLADAFGDVRVDFVFVEDAGLLVLLEHGAVRIDAPYLDRRILLLQELADAGDRASRADADHELRDRAVGLIPNLGTRLLVVSRRVRQVVVLVRLPRVGHFFFEARRHGIVGPWILGIDVGGTDDDLGAERLQRVDLLLGLLVGGREDALVAPDDGGDREAHAGVAGRSLDDRSAGFQQTGTLGVLDHLHRHAVLDRVAGVERLDLRQHRAFHDAFRQPIDADHRRVADRVEHGVADLLPHRCRAGLSGPRVQSIPWLQQ